MEYGYHDLQEIWRVKVIVGQPNKIIYEANDFYTLINLKLYNSGEKLRFKQFREANLYDYKDTDKVKVTGCE